MNLFARCRQGKIERQSTKDVKASACASKQYILCFIDLIEER